MKYEDCIDTSTKQHKFLGVNYILFWVQSVFISSEFILFPLCSLKKWN